MPLKEPALTIRVKVALAYFIMSFASAWFFAGYLKTLGGWGHVPFVVSLFFGPVLALSDVHGIVIFIVTTVAILPLLFIAVSSEALRRWLSLGLAIFVWLGVGYWMA